MDVYGRAAKWQGIVLIERIGVPKHFELEPDYFLPKGNGNTSPNGGLAKRFSALEMVEAV